MINLCDTAKKSNNLQWIAVRKVLAVSGIHTTKAAKSTSQNNCNYEYQQTEIKQTGNGK